MKISQVVMISLGALLSISASPPAPTGQVMPSGTFYPLPDDPTEGVIVPPDSPVRFRGFGKYGVAQFDGRFVLTGTVVYGCAIDCEEKPDDRFLRADVVPDPAGAARLPHWKRHDNDIRIVIDPPERFVRTITTSSQRVALRSGKLADVRGRIAVVVDHFEASIECDSASFFARFVSTASPPRFAKIEQIGDYGCG